MPIPCFARQRGDVSETGHCFFERFHLSGIQQVFLRAGTENEVYFMEWHFVMIYILDHTPERRYPGTGANEEQFFFKLLG